MKCRTVSWVTPYSFIDVDLPIVAELQKEVVIYWQILVDEISDDIKIYVESQLKEVVNLKYEFINNPYRVYDLRTLLLYFRVLRRAKSFKPDIYYTSLQTAPFGPIIYKLIWPMKRSITACHNVSTPKGANREYYARFYTYLTLRAFHNIQVFSESQRAILLNRFPKKNVLMAPLAIKDYGKPSVLKRTLDEDHMVFLFFGIISPYKRLDLLIKAAQSIYELGYKNFIVKIAGKCKSWSDYASLIKYPELFDLRIERIPNSEVADLFANSDYFVMPYQDIAQSGAITVAYRYNLPIILSNLPQFKPYCEDCKTGLFFESKNVEDLEKAMIKALNGGRLLHDSLKKGLSEFVEDHFSIKSIVKKYLTFFDYLDQV